MSVFLWKDFSWVLTQRVFSHYACDEHIQPPRFCVTSTERSSFCSSHWHQDFRSSPQTSTFTGTELYHGSPGPQTCEQQTVGPHILHSYWSQSPI
jgi:hypothetical protein